MRSWQRRFLALVGLVVLAGAGAGLAIARGRAAPANRQARTASRPARTSGPPGRRAGPTTTTAPAITTTTTSATTTTSVPATQTSALPSAATAQFRAEMADLFRGTRLGVPALAAPAFFPESAYARLKTIPYPAADYTGRLLADYGLDLMAAHAYLGAVARQATLVGVTVPDGEAAWIPPGYCNNGIGYWHDPGARLLYREDGELRSIGIASLISWHGVWYVVHLGAVLRSSTTGIVDSPAVGPGTPGPPGGC